jgi:SOUL heme-binding protein
VIGLIRKARAQNPEKKRQEMSKTRKKLLWALAGTVILLLVSALAAGPIMSRVEQPEYTVLTSEGAIEIRAYGPMIAAETVVEGERKAAINEGFRRIAAYIFGANTPNATIAMTAPVLQQEERTIAMTAPVLQQSDGKDWKVRFIMPGRWSLETLPTPADPRVALKPVPARRMLAIRFSGRASENDVAGKREELRRYAAGRTLATVGEPLLAFYNPPWTLPFLRRNEIMLELAAGAAE